MPRLVTDPERFAAMLHDLVEFYESPRAGRWQGDMPVESRDRLMQAIVGVEIEITRMEGKFKLSQNRPEDAHGVMMALAASADQTEREVAAMKACLNPCTGSGSKAGWSAGAAGSPAI